MATMLNRVSLRAKIVTLVIALTCGSALVLAGLHQIRTRAWLKEESLSRLELTGRIYAEGISVVFDRMRSDALENAAFPPVDGIMRASAAADGIDPEDGSTLEQWESRLARIFSIFLQTRPNYTQIRLIGRADDWRELVRADRSPFGAKITPPEGLQSKAHRDYLDGVARQGARTGYFSNVDQNIDFGENDGVVTIRIVHPVLDAEGDVFGAIVINADYEALLRSAAPAAPQGIGVTIIDHDGAFLEFGLGGLPGGLVFRDDPGWNVPLEWELAQRALDGDPVHLVGDQAYSVIPILRQKAGSPHWLSVVTRMPARALFARARHQLTMDAWTSGFLALAAVFLAILFARRITRPLIQLNRAIRRRGSRRAPIDFDVAAQDEVGNFARVFVDMTNDLIRESARMEAVLDSASEGIIIIDRDGIITDVNPAVARMFGHPKWDLLGAPLTRLMPPEDAEGHQTYVTEAAEAQRAPVMAPDRMVWGQRADGSRFPLEVSLGRADYDGSTHFIGVVHDITYKYESERQREVLIEALQRSNSELDQFAYVASHDLKAPLRVIDNASRWIEEDLEPHLTEDTRESIDMMRNRVQRMDRLLDALLSHSRIGRVETPTSIVRGDRMMEDLRDLVTIPDGFTLVVAPEFEQIELPRAPIQTVLMNLVSNAFKHHDRATGCVRVGVTKRADGHVFTVEDDGPGIPEQFRDKVFELFQTLRPRDQVESSGMGLAMVRKYVDLAGGTIEIRSAGAERGAVFVVFWPGQTGGFGERAA